MVFSDTLLEFEKLHNSNEYPDFVADSIRLVTYLNEIDTNHLLQTYFELEIAFHDRNEVEALLCIKRNFGTEQISMQLLKLTKPKSKFQMMTEHAQTFFTKFGLCSSRNHEDSTKIGRKCFNLTISVCSYLIIDIPNMLRQISLYYLDIFKDIFLVTLLSENIDSYSKSSFRFNIFCLSVVSIILPQVSVLPTINIC